MYRTKASFAGRRAKIGDVVVLNMNTKIGIQVGLIQTIGDNDGISFSIWDATVAGGPMRGPGFVETSTDAEIEALPPFSWTWPLE
jgi:hypothetical protein